MRWRRRRLRKQRKQRAKERLRLRLRAAEIVKTFEHYDVNTTLFSNGVPT